MQGSSLGKFIEETKAKRLLKNEEVRAERKLDLLLLQGQSFGKKLPCNMEGPAVKSEYKIVEPGKKINILLATTGTSLVMVAGLLLALVSNPHLVDSSSIQVGAMTDMMRSANQASVTHSLTIDSFFDREVVPRFGMVMIPEFSTTSTTSIQNSFSDEVQVHFQNVNTGIVQPQFKSGAGEDYAFIVVPTEPS